MHADGKSTFASISKWNSGKVNSFQYQKYICVIAHKNKREDFRQMDLFLFV